MAYYLKHFDSILAVFDMIDDIEGICVTNLHFIEGKRQLLPLGLSPDESGLASWLEKRTIPRNRAYVQNLLTKAGLNSRNRKGILDYCKGLSLNDCYWVCDENFKGDFASCNLYQNKFSSVLASIAFTGYGTLSRSSLTSSPEFTTNGMLAKCWRRQEGKIVLYKSGTVGFSNAGKEPYSEFYAYQIAQTAGFDAVAYGLAKWKNHLCSTCELFTSLDISYVPAGKIIKTGGIEKVIEYCQGLGDGYINKLSDMFVFDYLIMNSDRHYGNFGFLVDNSTNWICGFAPLFDHGASLLAYADDNDLRNLAEYLSSLHPVAFSDFLTMAKRLLGPNQKAKVRRLLGFRFKKHPRYNLPDSRLSELETLVRQRASSLLS